MPQEAMSIPALDSSDNGTDVSLPVVDDNFWPEFTRTLDWPRKRPTAAVTVRVQRTLPLIGGVAGRRLRGSARQGLGIPVGTLWG